MELGKVVGNVWATRKDEKLNGQKFLIVKILISKHKEKEGLFVAVDNVGAGTGDTVLITKGGAARQSIGNREVPIDAAIVGIVDSIDLED
ncbi:EutN/CcmL family microcompartment protein [Clostridium sp. LIBA-8841]|uniref:EutN/CcmL family microcompartment protein n=1 Tax=Clostridium sp. LIBA-8841 TaxID=2987530 RepID=UPI002AC6339A|nr:EutN/CcmL family microcompartment protein [Clostridium sp. LIBA-8841]MDZ5253853.1 EutN/CcmL family microcompartment protein [Clostridium sp. LIBA-8841]